MHKDFGYIIFSFLMVLIIGGNNASAEDATTKKRPFFEYKGNYTEQVNALKEKFKQEFGYALVDLGKAWSPVEVEKMHVAFSKLPKNFYRLTGLNSLYRLDHFQTKAGGFPVDEIPALLPSSLSPDHPSSPDTLYTSPETPSNPSAFLATIPYSQTS